MKGIEKKKHEHLLQCLEELESAQKYSEALAALKQARPFATSQTLKSVDEKINALRMKMSQGSLFEMPPEQPREQQSQQAQQQVNKQPIYNNGQQAVVQPTTDYTNGNYPPVNTGQPTYTGQPAYNKSL